MRITILALAVAAAAGGATPAGAQTESGLAARTFELRSREGQARQLDDGYRRHLDWHAAAGDRSVWYLWEVTNGERAGLYVDGTFGRAWADFDAAVDPPGDAADNDVNVEPFAVRAANHAWRLRPDLGGAPVDLEAAPIVARAEYRVRPGAEDDFIAALRRLRGPPAKDSRARAYAVYELVTGGDAPTYVLWVPAATWAAAGEAADLPAALAGGDPGREAAGRALAVAAERVRRELWRFRPDLSICRTPAARCHRTLGGGPVAR